MITKLLFAIGIIALIVVLAWGCKEKKQMVWNGKEYTCEICYNSAKKYDSLKTFLGSGYLMVDNLGQVAIGKPDIEPKPAQGIVITNKGVAPKTTTGVLSIDLLALESLKVNAPIRRTGYPNTHDTIPKKDTVPSELFTMPYMDDQGINPHYFNERMSTAFVLGGCCGYLQHQIDSLKLEVKKATYIINLIDSIQKIHKINNQ